MAPLPAKKRSFFQTIADESMSREEFKNAFGHLRGLVQTLHQSLSKQMDAHLARTNQIEKGKDGYTPKKGVDYFDGKDGYTPKRGVDYFDGTPGKDGKDADETRVASRVMVKLLPQARTILTKLLPLHLPNHGTAIRDALASLKGEDRLDASSITGLDPILAERERKLLNSFGPGGGTSFSLQQSGTQKVQQPSTLNFTGAGAPTITHTSGGVTNLSFPAGFTSLAATETPNGSRTAFTFAGATAQPRYINADNVLMRATTQKGTVNWTWNASTNQATMTVAPQDEIFAIV